MNEHVAQNKATAFSWFLSFRWCTIAAQLLLISGAYSLGAHVLPFERVGFILVLSLLSNLFFSLWKGEYPEAARRRVVTLLLFFDALVLFSLLRLTGGPSNPFSILFLVYIVLAAVLLDATWA